MDMNKIAQMSCNPAIRRTKGQIVREIDAMVDKWVVADKTHPFRMLNCSKGPAM